MSNRRKPKAPRTPLRPPPEPKVAPPPIDSTEWGRIHREGTRKALMACTGERGCPSSIHYPGCWV